MTPVEMIPLLLQAGVRFVVIGGVAANAHGSARITFDLDIVFDPAEDNRERLGSVLSAWRMRLRGAPRDLPWVPDARSLAVSHVLTLESPDGKLDVMDELAGVGDYRAVLSRSEELTYEGHLFRVLKLDALIAAKRAANRATDRSHLVELEALYAKLHGREPPRVKEPTRRPRRSRGRRRA